MSNQILVLTNVPAAEIDDIELKYKQMGVKIEKTKQSDSSYTLRITVPEDEDM